MNFDLNEPLNAVMVSVMVLYVMYGLVYAVLRRRRDEKILLAFTKMCELIESYKVLLTAQQQLIAQGKDVADQQGEVIVRQRWLIDRYQQHPGGGGGRGTYTVWGAGGNGGKGGGGSDKPN